MRTDTRITPDHYLSASPRRLREVADWLDQTGLTAMALAARRAASDIEGPGPEGGRVSADGTVGLSPGAGLS